MPVPTWRAIWNAHPGKRAYPCDRAHFTNQCGIRMSVALAGAGVNLSRFRGARCYPGLDHGGRHILRAQELANWIVANPTIFGAVAKRTGVTSTDHSNTPGIVFIRDGWGAVDHIDIWSGTEMSGGDTTYFAAGKEVWFWALR
jgi:hypothetical protein